MIGCRWLSAAVVAGIAVAVSASVASAGGAVWSFDRASYRPGDVATASTAVWWDGDGLGTPADGPYLAYVISSDELARSVTSWPSIPTAALLVAEVDIGVGPIEQDGILAGPNHAVVRFTVPQLPPGTYDLLHCNAPCTTTLGDIVWGQFTIEPATANSGTPASTPPAPTQPEAPQQPAETGSNPHGVDLDSKAGPALAPAIVLVAASGTAVAFGISRLRRPARIQPAAR